MKMMLCLLSLIALASCSTNSSGGSGPTPQGAGGQPGQQTPQGGQTPQETTTDAHACYGEGLALQETPTEIFDLCKELSGQVTSEAVIDNCQKTPPVGSYKPVQACPQNPLAGCSFRDENQPVRMKLYFYRNPNMRQKFIDYCRQQNGTPF